MPRRALIPRGIRTEMGRQMAQPLIQSGNIAQKLISALGIHGKVAAPTLGDLVHPVVMVEDLTNNNWWSQGVDRPAFGGNELTASVGNLDRIAVCNPAGSNVVIFVEEATVWGSIAAKWFLLLTQAFPANSSPTAFFRDTTILAGGSPAGQIRTEQPAASPGGALLSVGSASTTNLRTRDICNVILAPGWCLCLETQIANVAISATFKWRERFIDA